MADQSHAPFVTWRERMGKEPPADDPAIVPVGTEASSYQKANAAKDTDNLTLVRDLWFSWLFLAYAPDQDRADQALERLIAAMRTLHAAARGIVNASPRRHASTFRPRSVEEE